MDYIDHTYCGLVSQRVDQFKVKQLSPYKANLRCPLCGDSQKSKTKARGWLLEYSGSLFYHCHNCGAENSKKFTSFLRNIDINLYNQYIVDKKINNISNGQLFQKDLHETLAESIKQRQEINLQTITDLREKHPARQYVENRLIPQKHYKSIYYTPTYNKWVNSIVPDKLKETMDEPRLVFPFLDENGEMFGFTGRSFKSKGLRYITIMLDTSKKKVFGLDKIDYTKPYYIVEGPIDSLFIENAIAMSGSDLDLNSFPNPSNMTVVFDNEPRNKEIHAKMMKTLEQGFKVCIWPTTIEQKDLNEMFKAGISNIQNIIDSNSHAGLMGKLSLSAWKKI